MPAQLHFGDCLDVLRTLPTDSVHSVVTDPPAGIGLLGLAWDSDKGGRAQWIAWLSEVMQECRRVLKPGGHALVWAFPRTSHWTATAIEEAGFEVRNVVTHIFRGGVPASVSIGAKIDKALGVEPKIVGYKAGAVSRYFDEARESAGTPKLEPSTIEGNRFKGWGASLKPANEHWILARKPLSERNLALNMLAHETGALNIDACRVGTAGKFPSNLLLSHAPDCGATTCAAGCPVAALTVESAIDVSEDFKTFTFSGKTRKQERKEDEHV